jgi:hypothetical protein
MRAREPCDWSATWSRRRAFAAYCLAHNVHRGPEIPTLRVADSHVGSRPRCGRTARWQPDYSDDRRLDMEVPSTPRMPPFNRGIFLAAIGGDLVYAIAVAAFQPTLGQVYGLWGCLVAAFLAIVFVRALILSWRIRRTIHLLRAFDAPRRSMLFANFDDEQARAYLEKKLEAHGSPESEEDIERFYFSPVDRREIRLATWTCALAASGVLIPLLATSSTGPERSFGMSCGLGLALASVAFLRRGRRLGRAFKVTPDELIEVSPDGSVRSLKWAGSLTLQNRPFLRRIEVSATGQIISIEIPYSVVGFDRLTRLIVINGGFPIAAA